MFDDNKIRPKKKKKKNPRYYYRHAFATVITQFVVHALLTRKNACKLQFAFSFTSAFKHCVAVLLDFI